MLAPNASVELDEDMMITPLEAVLDVSEHALIIKSYQDVWKWNIFRTLT